MKIYTKEQVREAYNAGFIDGYEVEERCEESAISVLTPIELPSDEEIKEASKIVDRDGLFWENEFARDSFVEGAKWTKEQLLNQNK